MGQVPKKKPHPDNNDLYHLVFFVHDHTMINGWLGRGGCGKPGRQQAPPVTTNYKSLTRSTTSAVRIT